jgi:hypothetical protein
MKMGLSAGQSSRNLDKGQAISMRIFASALAQVAWFGMGSLRLDQAYQNSAFAARYPKTSERIRDVKTCSVEPTWLGYLSCPHGYLVFRSRFCDFLACKYVMLRSSCYAVCTARGCGQYPEIDVLRLIRSPGKPPLTCPPKSGPDSELVCASIWASMGGQDETQAIQR